MINHQVAIIDDDVSACGALSRVLRGVGLEPSTFSSAETFLADRARARFACLLVDMKVAEASGLELQRQLLAEGSHTPVIYLTAVDEPSAWSQAAERGCAGLFRKTDPGALIIEAVRRVATASGKSGLGTATAASEAVLGII
jgi:FixJ family two-component response regulator